MDFPTELGILTCLMIFAASLWIPFIVCSANLKDGDLPDGAPRGFIRPHNIHLMLVCPLIFTTGWVCTLIMAYSVFTAAWLSTLNASTRLTSVRLRPD